MKSERRHELQHNMLADWLVQNYQKIRPYGNTIVGAIAVVVLVLAGWLWWTQTSAFDQSVAWNQLFEAQAIGEPGRLSDVAEQHQGTAAAGWALVVAGDMYLATGCEQLFSNKATATQELNKAVESYQKALRQTETSMIRERATFGLARAYEALSGTRQSELEKALQNYQALLTNWKDGVYAKAAQQRLDDLQRPATKQFYDQFAKYDPKPAFTEEPGEKLRFDPNALPEPESLPRPSGETKSEPASSEPASPASAPQAPAPPASEPAKTPAGDKTAEPIPAAPPVEQ